MIEDQSDKTIVQPNNDAQRKPITDLMTMWVKQRNYIDARIHEEDVHAWETQMNETADHK